MSAKDTWETLRSLWIDTHQGPPDIIPHDAGTDLASTEFHNKAKVLGITCKQVPIEAHWSISKLERYHPPLRRAFEILFTQLESSTIVEAILQMALRQSYERREIAEIRWINGKDNPSDAMTKASPNRALERFVNDELTIRMEGFVQRTME
jgi:hypothetical protein